MSTIEVKDCYQSKYVVTAQGISKHKSNLPKGVCGYSALFGRGMRWIERLSGQLPLEARTLLVYFDNLGVYLKIETSENLDLNKELISPPHLQNWVPPNSGCCQFVTEQWYNVFIFIQFLGQLKLFQMGLPLKKIRYWYPFLNSPLKFFIFLFICTCFLHIKNNILLIIYVANKFSQFVHFF